MTAAHTELLATARARYPDIVVDDQSFAEAVEAKLSSGNTVDTIDAAELYLAVACEQANGTAIALFEAAYFSVIDVAVAPMKLPGGMLDEIRQLVRTKLFVGDGTDGAKVTKYAGQGSFEGLVRVVAVRTALDLLRKSKKEVPLDAVGSSPVADEILAVTVAPELQLVKQRYRAHFKQAFESAIDELSARERAILKLHVIDHLSIDEIGALYKVHRATAARWLEAIRDRLGERTRAIMGERVGIAAGDLDSVINVIQSQVDLTLSRILHK